MYPIPVACDLLCSKVWEHGRHGFKICRPDGTLATNTSARVQNWFAKLKSKIVNVDFRTIFSHLVMNRFAFENIKGKRDHLHLK